MGFKGHLRVLVGVVFFTQLPVCRLYLLVACFPADAEDLETGTGSERIIIDFFRRSS